MHIEPTVQDITELVAPPARRAGTLHRLASRRRARERFRPAGVRSERGRNAVCTQHLLARRRDERAFSQHLAERDGDPWSSTRGARCAMDVPWNTRNSALERGVAPAGKAGGRAVAR
jgi:hypothetical protein